MRFCWMRSGILGEGVHVFKVLEERFCNARQVWRDAGDSIVGWLERLLGRKL